MVHSSQNSEDLYYDTLSSKAKAHGLRGSELFSKSLIKRCMDRV
jgi:hypothetical protein